MTDTGRLMVLTQADGSETSVQIDTDVLVTEQRLIELGLPADDARQLAARVVDAAINAPCPCCDAEAEQ